MSEITKLPDGSAFFTTTVMSKDEAMALPLNKRPLCYRISSEIYLAVFEAIAEGSRCWVDGKIPKGVFDSEHASRIATDLCFKIASELDPLREALKTAVNTVECASIDPNTKEELPWHKQAKAALSQADRARPTGERQKRELDPIQ